MFRIAWFAQIWGQIFFKIFWDKPYFFSKSASFVRLSVCRAFHGQSRFTVTDKRSTNQTTRNKISWKMTLIRPLVAHTFQEWHWTHPQTNGANGQTVRQTDKRTNGQTVGQTDKRTNPQGQNQLKNDIDPTPGSTHVSTVALNLPPVAQPWIGGCLQNWTQKFLSQKMSKKKWKNSITKSVQNCLIRANLGSHFFPKFLR